MHRSIRMLRSFRHGGLGLVAVLLLVVLACGGDATSTPQPTATSTPQPTATSTPQPTAVNSTAHSHVNSTAHSHAYT